MTGNGVKIGGNMFGSEGAEAGKMNKLLMQPQWQPLALCPYDRLGGTKTNKQTNKYSVIKSALANVHYLSQRELE